MGNESRWRALKNEKCGAVGVVTKKKCVCHATAKLIPRKNVIFAAEL